MAKYDWKQLEKEYILSDHNSVSSFLKEKNIEQNGNTKKSTKGWKEKKVLKEDKKSTEIIEKTIEKEAEAEATQRANLKDIANDLALKIQQSMLELDRHIAKSKTKTKTVEYDNKIAKPTKEVIEEVETVKDYISIIDRNGLKQLTSALKDLNDILVPGDEGDENDNSFIQALKQKTGDVWNEEEE